MAQKFISIKNYSLTIFLLLLFGLSIYGQFEAGFRANNQERIEKQLPTVPNRTQYLQTGDFISSVSENMESEFLQMAVFVFFTVFLLQKGSAESKKPIEEKSKEDLKLDAQEQAYCDKKTRRHPILWRLYENSLSIALISLFLVFFFIHGYGSWQMINQGKLNHNEQIITYWQTFGESQFWFESFQNWQSEFFSVAVMGLLSIFLRQKDSPQSKRMNDPFWKTGG